MKRLFGTAAIFGFALAWSSAGFAQTSADRDWMGHMGWGWGGMIFGTLTMLIFLAGVVVFAVLLVRWLGAGGGPRQESPARPTALEILQERFAKGEIDKPEYEERKRVLKGVS